MNNEQEQKEFFEFEKPKRIFPGLAAIFAKRGQENRFAVTLTMERLIFTGIGLIMAMVMIYAIGVEAGKGMTRSKPAAALMPAAAKTKNLPAVDLHKTAAIPALATAGFAQNSSKPYTILAATFSRKDYAAREMGRLRQSGFDAFAVQSGQYFQVCVGTYADKDSAMNTLIKVRRSHGDARIKLR